MMLKYLISNSTLKLNNPWQNNLAWPCDLLIKNVKLYFEPNKKNV